MIVAEADYYELLGIDRGADAATVKAAYRKLAMDCHPDRFGHAAFQNGGGGGGNPFGSAGFEGFSDIFSSIFGEFMDPRAARQNAARGADLRYDLELTLEEAFTGAAKTIQVEALARCD